MKTPVRFFSLVFLFALLLSACAVPAPICVQDAIHYPHGQTLNGGPVQLGVMDASHLFTNDLPDALHTSQAALAVLDDVRWGHIEPNAPQANQHDYRWTSLDERVAAYQKAGFELVMVLRAWNAWARSAGPQGGQAAAAASTPPKEEYLNDYAAWVQAVVERYDADGIDDFAGLIDVNGDGNPDPIRYFQIETDATTGIWWQSAAPVDTAADYVTLLRTAKASVSLASSQAQVILAGATAADLLDQSPTATDLEDTVTEINPAVCGSLTAFQQILAASDAYDIIAVHSMADYSGVSTLANWVATLSPGAKPVWIIGATTAPALTADPQSISVNALFPTRGETLWNSLRDTAAADHDAVLNWYQAEQARLAFKKWVTAAASGFDAIIMGYEQDRPVYTNATFGLRDLAFQGLLDEPGDGPPAKRPAIYALAMTQAQLRGYSTVEKMDTFEEDVQAYHFTVEEQPVYALWLDDGQAQGPTDTPASRTIYLRTSETQLPMFIAPTQPGQTSPTVQTLTPTNGIITLTLTETPIIIRGEIAPFTPVKTFLPIITN